MTDRVVVVTGAARGLGAAVVAATKAKGWLVVGVDCDPIPPGTADFTVLGDLRDRATIDRAIVAARELGVLEGWVNNAAVAIRRELHLVDEADAMRVFEVNLFASFWSCQAAVQEFLRVGNPGVIVNVSSIQARSVFPGWAAYATAKGAIESLTRYIAVEYGPVGIRAVAVAPGTLSTDMASIAFEAEPSINSSDLHPLGRLGRPDEVANVIAFALSEDASFLSGTVIDVDGAANARNYPAPPFNFDGPLR